MLNHIHIDERRTAGAKGFTLIELLVVIIILGILAAVVVFAIGGVSDRGEQSACKTDLKTLKTAVAAWNGQYETGTSGLPTEWPTTEQLLVDNEFLDSVSSNYNIAAVNSGGDEPTYSKQNNDCPDP